MKMSPMVMAFHLKNKTRKYSIYNVYVKKKNKERKNILKGVF
jgi:hypothetical protein